MGLLTTLQCSLLFPLLQQWASTAAVGQECSIRTWLHVFVWKSGYIRPALGLATAVIDCDTGWSCYLTKNTPYILGSVPFWTRNKRCGCSIWITKEPAQTPSTWGSLQTYNLTSYQNYELKLCNNRTPTTATVLVGRRLSYYWFMFRINDYYTNLYHRIRVMY